MELLNRFFRSFLQELVINLNEFLFSHFLFLTLTLTEINFRDYTSQCHLGTKLQDIINKMQYLEGRFRIFVSVHFLKYSIHYCLLAFPIVAVKLQECLLIGLPGRFSPKNNLNGVCGKCTLEKTFDFVHLYY